MGLSSEQGFVAGGDVVVKTLASDPTHEEIQAALSHPDASYEIVDGQIVEKPAMGIYARWIGLMLYESLRNAAREGQSGTAVFEFMFVLDPTRPLKRQPDVAFVSYDRWPADREMPEMGEWEVVPDLVIEIISPHDIHSAVSTKVREYFELGVRQVWIIEPINREVFVYESPKRITVMESEDHLEGGDIVPGFRVRVGDLFRRTVGR